MHPYSFFLHFLLLTCLLPMPFSCLLCCLSDISKSHAMLVLKDVYFSLLLVVFYMSRSEAEGAAFSALLLDTGQRDAGLDPVPLWVAESQCFPSTKDSPEPAVLCRWQRGAAQVSTRSQVDTSPSSRFLLTCICV